MIGAREHLREQMSVTCITFGRLRRFPLLLCAARTFQRAPAATRYITADEAKEKGLDVKKLSGTKFRQMLRAGDEIPEWSRECSRCCSAASRD